MENDSLVIKKLTHRLESGSIDDRVDSLRDLQSMSRKMPDLVGELALRKTFALLRERSTVEEYSEALDLTSRLICCHDKKTALANTRIILEDVSNVELLLDLLEHSDLTVSVMVSQILSELHSNDQAGLETSIQQCPNGLIKLMNRLPDNSREEVRNQAIVLIQQLTVLNNEMKTTVAFNEGFEILFRIIEEEGGSEDAGIVVKDCLRICNNILTGSETCQRLFIGMGMSWIRRLSNFFDPDLLEKSGRNRSAMDADDMDEPLCWFDDSNRLSCAIFALMILYNALNRGVDAKKHQDVLLDGAPMVVSSAAFWLARNGPRELLSVALSFLSALSHKNPKVCHALGNLDVRFTPSVGGKNVPINEERTLLRFAWRPLPNDDRRCISFLSLLADRVVYPVRPWCPSHDDCAGELDVEYLLSDTLSSASHAQGESSLDAVCLHLFEKIISADSAISDMMIQFVLAPPPPPMLSDDFPAHHSAAGPLETMRPLGGILLQIVMHTCDKLLAHGGAHHTFTLTSGASKSEAESTERAVHLLSIVFMHGSLLARELITVITTMHLHALDASHASHHRELVEAKPLLPNILATVGRAARLPGGAGNPLVISILQLLAIVASGCERATKLLFEDPSNLFVVDLATSASELAGVPPVVQTMACFFLGCCCTAFPAEALDSATSSSTSPPASQSSDAGGSILQRRAFLSMIDSRIGLTRFNEILKKPLAALTASNAQRNPVFEGFFALPGFKSFYEAQVESVKKVIFEMYSGASASLSATDSAHVQVIAMQQEKIKELEQMLEQRQNDHTHGSSSANNSTEINQVLTHAVGERDALRESVSQLEQRLAEKEQLLEAKESTELSFLANMKQLERDLLATRETEQRERDARIAAQNELRIKERTLHELEDAHAHATDTLERLQREHNELLRETQRVQRELEESRSLLSSSTDDSQRTCALESELHIAQQENLRIKQAVLTEAQLRKELQESCEQRERENALLKSELTALRDRMDDVERKKQIASSEEQKTQELLAEKDKLLKELQLELVALKEEKGIEREKLLQLQQQQQRSARPHPAPLSKPIFCSAQESMEALKELLYYLDVDASSEEVEALLAKVDSESFCFDEDLDALLAKVLRLCQNAVTQAANTASEFAEALNIFDLSQGHSESLQRMTEIAQRLAELGENSLLSEQVIEEQHAKLQSAEATIASLERETAALREASDALAVDLDKERGSREQLLSEMESERQQRLQEQNELSAEVDAVKSLLFQKEQELSSVREEIALLQRDAEMEREHVSERVHSLEDELRVAACERERLLEEMQTIERELAEKEETAQQREGELSALRERLSVVEAERETLTAQLAESEERRSQTTSEQLKERESELNTLRERLAAVECERDSLHAEMENERTALNTRIAELESERERLSEVLRAKESECAEREQALLSLQIELAAERERDEAVAKAHAERALSLEEELSAFSELLVDKENELNVLRESLAELESERDAQTVRIAEMKNEISEFKEMLDAVETEKSALSAELQAEREQERSSSVTEEIAAEKDRLTVELETLSEQVFSLTEETDRLRDERETTQSALDTERERVASLLQLLEGGRTAHRESEQRLGEELSTISQQAQYLQSEIDTLREELTATSTQLSAKEEELSVLQRDAETERESLSERLQSLEDELRSALCEGDRLQEELQTKEREIIVEREKFEGLRAANEDETERERLLEDELAALRERLNAVESEREGLAAQVQAMEMETLNAKQALDSLGEQNSLLTEKALSLEEELKTSFEQLGERESELSALRERLTVVECERDTLLTERAALNTRIDELESERERLSEAVCTKESECAEKELSLQVEVSAAKTHVERVLSLEEELREKENELNTLRESLAAFESERDSFVEQTHAKENERLALNEALETARESLAALQKHSEEERESLLREKESADERVSLLQSQLSALETASQQEREEMQQLLQAVNKERTAEAERLSSRVLDLEDELKSVVDEKKRELQSLREEMDEQASALDERLEAAIAELARQFDSERETLREELSIAQQEKAKEEQRLAEFGHKLHAVESELSVLREAHVVMQKERESLEQRLSAANTELAKTMEEKDKWMADCLAVKRQWEGISGDKNHPFALQEQEMRRLSHSLDTLNASLHAKESELRETRTKLHVKEGEVAGLRESFKREKESYEKLNREFSDLHQSLLAEQRKVRELNSKLRDLHKNVPAVAEEDMSDISSRIASQSSHSTPQKSTHKSVEHAQQRMITPVKSSPAATVNAIVPHENIAGNISSTSKEVARLSAEMAREHKRYTELHEQHADLLSLLAQQEVELSVFKKAISVKLGLEESSKIEQEAQRNVVGMYGSYTNYRTHEAF